MIGGENENIGLPIAWTRQGGPHSDRIREFEHSWSASVSATSVELFKVEAVAR